MHLIPSRRFKTTGVIGLVYAKPGETKQEISLSANVGHVADFCPGTRRTRGQIWLRYGLNTLAGSHMSRRTLNLDDQLYEYLLAHSLREHPSRTALREATRNWPRAGMQISPEQGQFLALLLRLIGAQRAIKVGVFTGYSALTAALALPADGRLLACDISEADARLGQPYWQSAGVAQKIEFVVAPAEQTLRARLAAGEAETYDFAFIDADKTGYFTATNAWTLRCCQSAMASPSP